MKASIIYTKQYIVVPINDKIAMQKLCDMLSQDLDLSKHFKIFVSEVDAIRYAESQTENKWIVFPLIDIQK